MRITLISDTHGYLDSGIIKHLESADEIWHAGDVGSTELIEKMEQIKPLRGVYGNIDGSEIRAHLPLNQIFEIQGVKVFMTHIGGYPNRYTARVKEELKTNSYDLFISGHSHILKVMFDKHHELLHMNPGAAGRHGFHQIRTLLKFEINAAKIENLQVVELGKRSKE